MTMVEIRDRDYPDRVDAAHRNIASRNPVNRTEAELEILCAGAAAGLEVIDGIFGAGGRRTIRLSELLRFARDFVAGEMDGLLTYHHEEQITHRRRELAATARKS
jgi:hypothetical protein